MGISARSMLYLASPWPLFISLLSDVVDEDFVHVSDTSI